MPLCEHRIWCTSSMLFGFLVAGHDTSATTISWGLKFSSDNRNVQEKLRQCLRESRRSTKIPTALQVVHDEVPYLDTVVEEIARCSGT